MGLKITSFEFCNVRNYEHFTLDNIQDITLFIGPNAIGKTNLIEGLQLTTALTSFRNPKIEHLLNIGSEYGWIKTNISDGDRNLEIKLVLQKGKKEFYLNGKRKQAKSIRGILPSVLFCPDDLEFIKGSQSIKRQTLDVLGSQLSGNYYQVRKDYEKILKQKNYYLKEVVTHTYLESINEVLATVGAQLYVLRSRLVQELIPYIEEYYHELSGCKEKVSVHYLPSWLKYHKLNTDKNHGYISKDQAREELLKVMQQDYQREHDRRLALFGPHADQIEFMLDNRDAGLFASQGQQRSLVLSYKLAEMALIRDKLNQNPVLLLDDVMSELDQSRRDHLMSLISGNVQTFISSTHLGYFNKELLDNAQVISLGG